MCGKPLIAYSIEQARAAGFNGSIYVSTDSEQIAKVAEEWGALVPTLRPAHLATDDAPKVPVIQHLVGEVEAGGIEVDIVIDLDPTSPLRTVEDIHNARAMLDDSCDLVITGYRADKNPYFNMVEPVGDGTVRLSKPPPAPLGGRQGVRRFSR